MIRAQLGFLHPKFLLDKVFFRTVSPYIKVGSRQMLELHDLPELPSWLDPKAARADLPSLQAGAWRFLWDLTAGVRRRVSVLLSLGILIAGLDVAVGLLIHTLLTDVTRSFSENATMSGGIAAAVTLGLVTLLLPLAFQHYIYWAVGTKQVVINWVNNLVFARTLTLTREERTKSQTGDTINHLGSDTDSVAQFPWVVADIFFTVVVVLAVSATLYHFLGVAMIAGVGALLALTPLTRKVSRGFVRINDVLMTIRDERVSLMAQILSGIRIVKFFAWEPRFRDEIDALRAREVSLLRQDAVLHSFTAIMFVASKTVATVSALGVYLLLGNTLDAATVFTAIALLSLLDFPLGMVSHHITHLAQSRVGAERLMAFLRHQAQPLARRSYEFAGTNVPALSIRGLTAEYADAVTPALHDIELTVERGEAIAVVGDVGSGKSSLLLAILGEIPLVGGEVIVGTPSGLPSRIGFVPQLPFVRNASLRENLLFAASEKHVSVEQASWLSCLEPDIAALPAGFETEIGEQGVNLSGGQKQRLALARCVVSNPDIVLLDDPLSAVDFATEGELVDRLIFGAWSDKTRVVVTHRLEHLQRFDKIVILDKGRIVRVGPPSEVLQDPVLRGVMVQHGVVAGEPDIEPLRGDRQSAVAVVGGASPSTLPPQRLEAGENEPIKPARGDITEVEDRERGRVRSTVYWRYGRALISAGTRYPFATGATLIGCSLAVAILPFIQSAWVSAWTGAGSATGSGNALMSWVIGKMAVWRGDSWQNIGVYSALGFLVLLGSAVQYVVWSLRAVAAGQFLHNSALQGVLGTRIRFFDATPVGRILNRFSRDLDGVEREIPWALQNTIKQLILLTTTLLVLTICAPVLLIVLVPVFWVYYRLQDAYRRCGRDVRRLYSITISPRFAHYKETLDGLLVTRAFQSQRQSWDTYSKNLADHQRAFHGLVLFNRWFSCRVPILSAVVSCTVITSLMVGVHMRLLDVGMAGLVLIYMLQLTEQLEWTIRSFVEVEASMVGTERLLQFGDLLAEPDTLDCDVGSSSEAKAWPGKGDVVFENVSVRYADHLPLVLKEVSFSIPGGAHVGIVGRTGSGKSTLTQVLFRMVDVTAGRVLIGGKDIRSIPLRELRRALAIIPQDPSLFLGSMRANLDRFDEYSDDQIWNVLERVQMANVIRELPGGLSFHVRESGANLSQGQRQLLCLARALLIDARIVIMDEATASVDVRTDRVIQETLNTELLGRTVLTIAHRLETVALSDMTIELANGRLLAIRAGRQGHLVNGLPKSADVHYLHVGASVQEQGIPS